MDPEQENQVSWPRLVIGNVAVDLLSRERAMELIDNSFAAAPSTAPLAVVSANLDHLHHFADDCAWSGRTAVAPTQAGTMRWLTLLDGVPLVRTANRLSGRAWPKLSGSDLLASMLALATRRQVRVGFLGGTGATQKELRAILDSRYPQLIVAGYWAPERIVLTDAASSQSIAQEIARSRVDILVVSLSKPLQENWIATYGPATGARLILAFGAAVDFFTGRVRRAPALISNVGAEWFWRLATQPRRLSRRYLIEGPPALLRLQRSAILIRPPAVAGD
jgi:exopolysaccharide biosynthesis WecB/TagA/CpsF family protein